ncbi:unnamed protein product [Sphagnum jensenii]|uniref:Uncharacterized protein n=1 Tax=Sphagnum jensenii TaxID=128206 RepID=A0ABP1AMK7_9BRYO
MSVRFCMPLEEMCNKIMKFSTAVLKLPAGGRWQPLRYILTLFPPLVLALLSPDIFYKALAFAGTHEAAVAWFERCTDTCFPAAVKPIVPRGCFTLAVVMGAAAYNIGGATLGSGLSIPLNKSIYQ